MLSCLFFPAQLQREKVQLEQTLEQEQEQQIAKLTKKIERLEKDTDGKQMSLDQVCMVGVVLQCLDLK